VLSKFSKASNDNDLKTKEFLTNNSLELDLVKKQFDIYKSGPQRLECKLCKTRFSTSLSFVSFDVHYLLCDNCGHLNGQFADSEGFNNALYVAEDVQYSRGYEQDFLNRVQKIYRPKVDFLLEALSRIGINQQDISGVMDFGCGAGHFLRALEDVKIEGKGFEVSPSMARIGNSVLVSNRIEICKLEDLETIFAETPASVISLIGVLEHLSDVGATLDAFSRSKARFLYVSVPTLSLSALMQSAFPNVFPRVLSGGHTHLFTLDSLAWLETRWNLKLVGEWWFGSDFSDLFRSLAVSADLSQNKDTESGVGGVPSVFD